MAMDDFSGCPVRYECYTYYTHTHVIRAHMLSTYIVVMLCVCLCNLMCCECDMTFCGSTSEIISISSVFRIFNQKNTTHMHACMCALQNDMYWMSYTPQTLMYNNIHCRTSNIFRKNNIIISCVLDSDFY